MKLARAVLAASAAIIIGISVGAQTRPDFSGTWVITSPQSGAPTTLVVKQDATSVTESDGEGPDSHTVMVKLDGTSTRTTMPVHGTEEIVVISTAAWRDNTLVLSSAATYPNGNKRNLVRSWTLDGENQLQVEVNMTADSQETRTIKAVYKKK